MFDMSLDGIFFCLCPIIKEMKQNKDYVRIALLLRPDSGYCRGVLRGIQRYAQQQHSWGFRMTDKINDITQMFKLWKPSGIITFIYLEEQYALHKNVETPLVSIANVDLDARFPTVCVDDIRVGRVAGQYLLQRGFCHFGFVGFPRSKFSNERQHGFEFVLAESDYKPMIFHDTSWPNSDCVWDWTAERPIEEWLAHLPKPCAVLAANDAMAMRLSEVCRYMQIRIPEDIALLGVDNDDLFCELAKPQLSSVQLPVEQIGYEAAWLLDQIMQGQQPAKQSFQLPPMPVKTRQSTDIKLLKDSELAQVVRYIHEHAHEPITMEDVLDRFKISRRSLERKCRMELGRPPLQELIRVRLERAMMLLSQTSLPISHIAKQIGFASSKQFCTIFRQKKDMTPTAYRQQFNMAKFMPDYD